MKNKILPFIMASLTAISLLTSCGSSKTENNEEDEEISVQTLTVSNPEYYTKFKDKGISINVSTGVNTSRQVQTRELLTLTVNLKNSRE
ncbi:MAG: hypothetical protein K2G14_05280 [Ruminococcus sp.]|nr:hypothetical protein [Ruminococcus sp.]